MEGIERAIAKNMQIVKPSNMDSHGWTADLVIPFVQRQQQTVIVKL